MAFTEAEIYNLRKTLRDQLDDSCQFVSKTSSARKRADGLQMLLYARRDIAKRKLCETVQTLEGRLERLKNNIDSHIQKTSKEKEEFLSSEKQRLLNLIREVDEMCTNVEQLLQAGNEDKLVQDGPRLSFKLKTMMSQTPQPLSDDISILDFVPRDLYETIWSESNTVGYVKSSVLSPHQVTVVNCVNKAFVDIEEILTIMCEDCPAENFDKHVKVTVQNPEKKLLEVERKCKLDGSFTVSFTPVSQGKHTLRVTVYDVDITDSPFTIDVSEVTSEVSSQESDVDRNCADIKESMKVRVNRSCLQVVREHIHGNTKPLPEPELHHLKRSPMESSISPNKNDATSTSTVTPIKEDISVAEEAGDIKTLYFYNRKRENSNNAKHVGSTGDGAQMMKTSTKSKPHISSPKMRNDSNPRTQLTNTSQIHAHCTENTPPGNSNVQFSQNPQNEAGIKQPCRRKPSRWGPAASRNKTPNSQLESAAQVLQDQFKCNALSSTSFKRIVSENKTGMPPEREAVTTIAKSYEISNKPVLNKPLSVQCKDIEAQILAEILPAKDTKLPESKISRQEPNNSNISITETDRIVMLTSKLGIKDSQKSPVNQDENNNRGFVTFVKTPSASNIDSGTSILEQHVAAQSNTIKAAYVRSIGYYSEHPRDKDGLSYPIGVAVNSAWEVIICDNGHNCVKVFEWAGGCKAVIRIGSEKSHPSAVVTNDKDEIFVKDDFEIVAFSRQGSELRRFGRGTLKRPYGLALNNKGNLILLDVERVRPRVYEFSQNGELVSQGVYEKLQSVQRNTKCRFLDVHDDKLIVADLGLSDIYLSTQSGKLIKQFGGYGSTPGLFNQPSGVAADKHGNLVIADSRNDRIQYFTPEGRYAGRINLEWPIKRPSDICLTKDNHLLVSCLLGHCVNVYKLLPP